MRLKLLAVALAALAPVVAMLSYNEYALRQQRNEEIRAAAAQAAKQASSEVERIVEGLHALLISVTSMPSVRDLDRPACSEALRSVADKVGNIRTIFVLDPRGNPVCSSLATPVGTNFADRDYFRQVMETKDFVVGAYTKSRISDISVLPLAMPLLEGDVVRAVVVTGIRLDWLQNRITERGVAPGNAVTLADTNGTIVARMPFPERFVGTVIPSDFLSLVHAEAPGVRTVQSQDGTDRILGYRPISLPGSPLYVSAGFSQDEAFAPINRATLMNILAIIGGALIALSASFLLGNRFILRPVAQISGVMDRWRAGETKARTGMAGDDELAKVGSTLDRLLDELECRRLRNERAEEERMLLVRELTHRVKNGFALVQAMSHQTFARSEPKLYRSFSERLAALATTYDLILSKESSASSIGEVVSAALKAHVDPGGRKIQVDGPEVVVSPEVALSLSLIVHELATNATKYGGLSCEQGEVKVTWEKIGARATLTWTETGGPHVSVPEKKGFGSLLIARAFSANAQAQTSADYRSTGLIFEISFLTEPDRSSGVPVEGEVD